MALILLQSGREPLGQFDGYDSQYLLLKGGEVVTFYNAAYPNSGTPAGALAAGYDRGVYDVFDGYVPEPLGFGGGTVSGKGRPAVTNTIADISRPLFLADEGTTNYGTLFGQIVGGLGGQIVNTGSQLGPQTATGSGKVTLWGAPGLYGVTIDATDPDTTWGVVPANVTNLLVGTPLGSTSAGLLTIAHAGSNNVLKSVAGGTAADGSCATFVEFQVSESLVTTPQYLVGALNSPSSSVSSAVPRTFKYATIWWSGQVASVG